MLKCEETNALLCGTFKYFLRFIKLLHCKIERLLNILKKRFLNKLTRYVMRLFQINEKKILPRLTILRQMGFEEP